MILSKYCVDGRNHKTSKYNLARYNLEKQINTVLATKINAYSFYSPDAIISGDSLTAFCANYLFDGNGNLKDGVEITRFFIGIREKACYQVNVHEKMAFGLAIAHLLMALDFIRLNPMPWDKILMRLRCRIRHCAINFILNCKTIIKFVMLL